MPSTMFSFGPARGLTVAAFAFALLAGCSAIPRSTQTVEPPMQPASTVRNVLPAALSARIHPAPPAAGPGWMSAEVATTRPIVYVSGYFCDCVQIYAQAGTNQKAIGEITGLGNPEGLTVDAKHTLYVANTGASNVVVFHRGAKKPFRTLVDAQAAPVDVAVRGDGTIYVANLTASGGKTGNVQIYAPGSNTPSGILSDPNFNLVYSVGVDKAKNVYVGYTTASGQPEVDEFPAGSTQPTNLNLAMAFTVGGIQFNTSDDLVIADGGLISTFPQGSTSPTSQFGQDALYLAFNRTKKRIYSTDAYFAQIEEYSYPAGTLINTIKIGWSGANPPFGVATDPAPAH